MNTPRARLDDIGILRGTDKSSLNHGYLRHYERILGHLRDQPVTLLEIGVFRGGSLRMWEDYMTAAQIVGVDIVPEAIQYAGDRREIEIGSQADHNFLDELGRRRRPHVIIDDGSHMADHVILTFRTLFPHLRPDGIYIIEDLHFHAGPGATHWRGATDAVPQDLMLRLARLVSCPGTEGDNERVLAQSIDSMEFFHGCVVIRKRSPMNRAEVMAKHDLVERANLPNVWTSYALHLFNNTGNLDQAIDCVKRALEIEPKNPTHHEILSIILERASDLAGALHAAKLATELNPADKRRRARFEMLQKRAAHQ
jgi:tetratricopeptide (TPR) repeat protein